MLAVRDGRLDGAEASISSLQAAGSQTAAQVASAIASALLPYVQQTGLDAALALRDARLDGHDTDILALQTAGPFATSSDLTAAETSLQSAIDAVLAALTTGGGSNLINAQAWSGEITWDLLLGTNTVRNLHFNAPLSMSLQNEGFTLSLACDSYSIAQADSAIAAALVPYETAAQRDAAIAAALTATAPRRRRTRPSPRPWCNITQPRRWIPRLTTPWLASTCRPITPRRKQTQPSRQLWRR